MHSPTLSALTTDRVFARLDRFEVACPNCGRIISTTTDQRHQSLRLLSLSKRRSISRHSPRSKRVWEQVWNPLTHRLVCGACDSRYYCGLLLYPTGPRNQRLLDPPPDTVPNARELAALRAKSGGWLAVGPYKKGDEVNLLVEQGCSCPLKGWEVTCPVHGDPAATRKAKPGA